MAVVIGSDLGKDIAGEPLLRGISFKLERRDRMTLSGSQRRRQDDAAADARRRGLVDGGELVFAKGARVALHDQRPPRDQGVTLRDYVLGGARELVAIEGELHAGSSRRWPTAPTTRRRSAATRTPRRGSSTPAATGGASARWRRCTASVSPATRTSIARSRPSPAAS